MEDNIKVQIQKYLIESGNYEKISDLLTQKLLQEGWVDKVKDMAIQEMGNNEKATYTDVLSKIEPKAMDMVSESTKDDILKQIRLFLEDIVETE